MTLVLTEPDKLERVKSRDVRHETGLRLEDT